VLFLLQKKKRKKKERIFLGKHAHQKTLVALCPSDDQTLYNAPGVNYLHLLLVLSFRTATVMEEKLFEEHIFKQVSSSVLNCQLLAFIRCIESK